MMLWLIKHGLDENALISWNLTAWPLTRMPLLGARWIDFDFDPPLPHPDLCWLKIKHTVTHIHKYTTTRTSTHIQTPSSKENVNSCKVKHGKGETNYPPKKRLRLWGADHFSCWGLKPCCYRLLTTALHPL